MFTFMFSIMHLPQHTHTHTHSHKHHDETVRRISSFCRQFHRWLRMCMIHHLMSVVGGAQHNTHVSTNIPTFFTKLAIAFNNITDTWLRPNATGRGCTRPFRIQTNTTLRESIWSVRVDVACQVSRFRFFVWFYALPGRRVRCVFSWFRRRVKN